MPPLRSFRVKIVPSSISNSKTNGNRTKSLVAGVLLSILVLGWMEYHWRLVGHGPSVVDDEDLWALNRRSVYSEGKKALVLLGASRMELNISGSELKKLLPKYKIIQLAVNGTHPVAALKDLAEDEKFEGIVICSIVAPGFERRNWDLQQSYVNNFHEDFTLNDCVNRRIAAFLQSKFVLFSPHLKCKQVIERYVEKGLRPPLKYLTVDSERFKKADYSRVNLEKQRKNRVDRLKEYYEGNMPFSSEEWLKQALSLDIWVEKIERRGGEVVFVRFPTAGEHWDLDEKFYPKEKYWDMFAKKTKASTIHFKDVPALDQYDLPDLSHLDTKDAVPFTRALIEELFKMGILGEKECGQDGKGEF